MHVLLKSSSDGMGEIKVVMDEFISNKIIVQRTK